MNVSALAAHFAPDDIEWRIGQAGKKDDGTVWAKAFAYITNRAIQQRLDDVMGPGNWRNEEPRIIQIADADGKPVTAFLCGLSLKIGDEWVTKWDGSEPSDMEPVKGGLSGSMKRAAVQWGIGRYIYDLPEGWAKVSDRGRLFAQIRVKVNGQEQRVSFKWDPPDLPNWALPAVSENDIALPADGWDRLRQNRPPDVGRSPVQQETGAPPVQQAEPTTENPAQLSAYAPTEKQVAFYRRLTESPCFSEEERRRALEWLATKATRQTIKEQISWLKRQVETRRATVDA